MKSVKSQVVDKTSEPHKICALESSHSCKFLIGIGEVSIPSLNQPFLLSLVPQN
jgi:hypothetical protein